MFKYLDKSQILSEKQHGLRTDNSYPTNSLIARESCLTIKYQKPSIDAPCIDFSMSFDKAPPNRLLFKLSIIVTGGNLFIWIKGFLVGCQQRVQVNSKLSSWETVLSNAPRGRVMGRSVTFVCKWSSNTPTVISFVICWQCQDTESDKVLIV